eukprot:TRINITY_DN1809_c0_g1_i1.p1 TRINITY_DN1809_c0_g1~~TRINITY_DN1809_c0_g1_i1.p1  ORF type:complete len:883 (-),score=188.21 TRINITY_DN1809_c0_g1_i1:99-2747(-)
MAELAGAALSGVAGALFEVFGYNRKNFQYDREQRAIFEYQLAETRIKQVELWRKDVRDAIEFTPKKMEVYLLVIAIELTGAATCLCKARTPPGAPPWLVAAGVLAVCSAISYLFLGLWFGLHAFVAAQAYKVRILTQLVRLPIPTWTTMEAARTYGSDFESLKGKQMLRVPIVGGSQESWVSEPSPEVASAGTAAMAADPWGLERRGEGILELDPEVNGTALEKQRHVWLIREAAKYFNTYDAFCRVCMSVGTSSLSVFFCFYCLAYVCTELAAPVAAWGGMLIFCAITLLLLRTDQILSFRQYLIGSTCLFFSPVFCAVVTFMSSKHWGNPGAIEYLVPVGLFLKGCWFLYYLHIFSAAEHQTGAVLPRSFRAVLYVDVFGWAKHSSSWWQKMATNLKSGRLSVRAPNAAATISATAAATKNKLPATVLSSASKPLRPEDARHEVSAVIAGPLDANPAEFLEDEEDHHPDAHSHQSFRPGTFAAFKRSVSKEEEEEEAEEDVSSGADIVGDRAGIQPWRAFFFTTILLAVMWWAASFAAFYDVYYGMAEFRKAHYGLVGNQVAPTPVLLGDRIATGWGDSLSEPHGFTCDMDGTVFATAGRDLSGRKTLLQGRLSGAGSEVTFTSAPSCPGLDRDAVIQDLALHNCEGGANQCNALVLPLRGSKLVSCPMSFLAVSDTVEKHRESENLTQSWLAEPKIGRAWLEDRGGSPLEEHLGFSSLLHPEEMTSLSAAPCPAKAMNEHTSAEHSCLVVGTTASRIVHLSNGTAGVLDDSSDAAAWLPRRLLQKQGEEVPGPGSMALLGGGHYLGVLHREANTVHVLDLHSGGRPAAVWKLPLPVEDVGAPGSRFTGICAGGGALFALQAGPTPNIWRFPHPELPVGS